jgi:hypothetical protein
MKLAIEINHQTPGTTVSAPASWGVSLTSPIAGGDQTDKGKTQQQDPWDGRSGEVARAHPLAQGL